MPHTLACALPTAKSRCIPGLNGPEAMSTLDTTLQIPTHFASAFTVANPAMHSPVSEAAADRLTGPRGKYGEDKNSDSPLPASCGGFHQFFISTVL